MFRSKNRPYALEVLVEVVAQVFVLGVRGPGIVIPGSVILEDAVGFVGIFVEVFVVEDVDLGAVENLRGRVVGRVAVGAGLVVVVAELAEVDGLEA